MEKKNTVLLTVVAVATLLVAVVGATFAFFTAQLGAGASADVNVRTSTNDSLVYGTWAALNLTATQQNFTDVSGDIKASTGGTVELKANADAAAEYCYTGKFNVTANNFVYTTGVTATPELLLNVKKDNVLVITNKDITTFANAAQATIDIPTINNGTDYKHHINALAGATETDVWNIEVTFVNLAQDQQVNTGKSLTGTLTFDNTPCA
ncbi:MAG: hypothetical protein RR189_00355 [Bacilli bacterium]